MALGKSLHLAGPKPTSNLGPASRCSFMRCYSQDHTRVSSNSGCLSSIVVASSHKSALVPPASLYHAGVCVCLSARVPPPPAVLSATFYLCSHCPLCFIIVWLTSLLGRHFTEGLADSLSLIRSPSLAFTLHKLASSRPILMSESFTS